MMTKLDAEDLHRNPEKVFQKVFDRPDLTINDAMTAADVDGWDSWAMINLVFGAEAAFSVRFRTAEIRMLKNVGEFKRLIAEKLAAGRL